MTSRLRTIWSRVKSFLKKETLDREFDEELATHLALLTDELRRQGLAEADARRDALRNLGGPASLREQHRCARGLEMAYGVSIQTRSVS